MKGKSIDDIAITDIKLLKKKVKIVYSLSDDAPKTMQFPRSLEISYDSSLYKVKNMEGLAHLYNSLNGDALKLEKQPESVEDLVLYLSKDDTNMKIGMAGLKGSLVLGTGLAVYLSQLIPQYDIGLYAGIFLGAIGIGISILFATGTVFQDYGVINALNLPFGIGKSLEKTAYRAYDQKKIETAEEISNVKKTAASIVYKNLKD